MNEVHRIVNRLLASLGSVRTRVRARVSRAARPGVETSRTGAVSTSSPLSGIEVAVYFASPQHSLYQLLPWLETLQELNRTRLTCLVVRDYRVFRSLKETTPLPVVFAHSFRDLSGIVGGGDVKTALYVNHASANYQMLRFSSMLHVHIGHGESEKEYMSSNQVKAYDYVFVAGPAGVDRLTNSLYKYDAERAILVGRPQLRPLEYRPTDPPTVLYAPTYEGDIIGSSYSSVAPFGVEMTSSVVDSGKYALIYRPHPLTGIHDPDTAKADREIRQRLAAAGDPHRVDTTSSLHDLMSSADVLIGDVSSVVIDWLSHNRPYLITDVRGDRPSPIQRAGALIGTEESRRCVEFIDSARESDAWSDDRQRLALYHFGAIDPEAPAQTFIDAVDATSKERDNWLDGLAPSNRPES